MISSFFFKNTSETSQKEETVDFNESFNSELKWVTFTGDNLSSCNDENIIFSNIKLDVKFPSDISFLNTKRLIISNCDRTFIGLFVTPFNFHQLEFIFLNSDLHKKLFFKRWQTSSIKIWLAFRFQDRKDSNSPWKESLKEFDFVHVASEEDTVTIMELVDF